MSSEDRLHRLMFATKSVATGTPLMWCSCGAWQWQGDGEVDLGHFLVPNDTTGEGPYPNLDEFRALHQRTRRAGFPTHRVDDECYCDTCWAYLSEEAGGDPEKPSARASAKPSEEGQ